MEITSAYYDKDHAKFLWGYDRGDEDAVPSWHGTGDPHEALASAIIEQVAEKCLKRYGNRTLLLIEVPPGLTVVENLQARLKNKTFPTIIPFMGVYVVGRFPEGHFTVGGHRVFSPTGDRVLTIKKSILTDNLFLARDPTLSIQPNADDAEADFKEGFETG